MSSAITGDLPLARQMPTSADEQATAAVIEALRDGLRPHHGSDGVTRRAAAWLVTAQR